MWASTGPGPSSKSPKQRKSDGRVSKIYNSVTDCQREIATDEIQGKKNYRERSNMMMKSARVSALTGSVPRNMAEAWQRNSAFIRYRTHASTLVSA